MLATIQTASRDEFRGLCVQGDHLFMVADEAHRLGATGARRLFDLETGPRLGLSATPERAGDPEGTAALMAYFGGVVPPPFTLADAIRSEALTPYAYHVHTVRLDADERTSWDILTERFRRLYARHAAGGGADEPLSAGLKLLLIQRARIIKGARAKTDMAADVRANNGRERTDRLRAQTTQPSFWASSPLVGQCEWTAGLTPGRGRRKGISNA